MGEVTTGVVAGASATMPAGTNVGFVVVECVRSEPAQQLSACAWLTVCLGPEFWDSDLCIGHAASLRQHAIRASGVACQPAHTAMFPTQSVRTAAIVAKRWPRVATFLRMLDAPEPVKSTLT